MPLEDYYVGDAAFARFASCEDRQLDATIHAWSGWKNLVAICNGDPLLARGEVEFDGVRRVCHLACVPEALAWTWSRFSRSSPASGTSWTSSGLGAAVSIDFSTVTSPS